MSFPLVQSSYALLQSEQGFVDLGPIYFRLFVLVHVVSSPFVASQINERHLRKYFLAVFYVYLHDSMRPGRVRIGGILRGYPQSAAFLNYI